jgi:cytochrome c biogenesis protein CcdA
MTDKKIVKNERLRRLYKRRRLNDVISFVLFLLLVFIFSAGFTLATYTVVYYYMQVGFDIIIKSIIVVFGLFFILLITFVIFYERSDL